MNFYELLERVDEDFFEDADVDTDANSLSRHCCENFMKALEELKHSFPSCLECKHRGQVGCAAAPGRMCAGFADRKKLIAELEEVDS